MPGRLRLGAVPAAARPPRGWPAGCPSASLVPLAEFAGDLWYRATPERAAQARRNLRRVATDLAARGRGSPASAPPRPTRARSSGSCGSPTATPRATTSRSRERPACARATSTSGSRSRRRTSPPRRSARAAPSIFVGLHFGGIELPGMLLATRVGGAVAPMETLDDPRLQAWFVRTRGAVGLRIVGLREARRELQAALRDGTSVGLVGDRDLTGGGMPTELFGAPAQLPLGPAMLAVESGAPVYVVGARRVGRRVATSGRLDAVDVPAEGSRRERVTATMAAIARGVRAHHRGRPGAVVGGVLPDLAGPRGGGGGAPAAPAQHAAAAPERADHRPIRRAERRPAAPTCTSTPSRRTARPTSPASSSTSRRAATSTSSPSRTTSGSTPPSAAQAMARDRGLAHRGRRRRGGHDARWPPAGAVDRPADPALPLAAHDDQGRPRRRRPGDPGPSARALPAVRPGPGPAQPHRRRRRDRSPGRPRDVQSDGARPPVARSCRALRR